MKSEFEALYNKYRPRTIHDLVGQDHIALTLTKAFEKKRLYQAYLFHGSRGCGKTTTARILAMGYNCEKGPTPTPCGECQPCIDILNDRCIDIVELDAASKTSVADIRELQQSAMTSTSQVKVKFYIVDEVHRISAQAQDAFLKTLEEPPSHVVFVLCTTEMDKLKDTIISRVVPLEFRRIPPEKIAERLAWIVQQEKFTADHAALLAIAKTCEGGMRDAIVKLSSAMCVTDSGHITIDTINTIIGSTGSEQCVDLANAIIAKDPYKIFQIIGKVADSTTNLQPFYMNIMNYFRGLLALSSNPAIAKLLDITDSMAKSATEQAQEIGTNQLLSIMKKIFGYNRLVDSIKGRMVLETMCLEIMSGDDMLVSSRQTVSRQTPLPVTAQQNTNAKSTANLWEDIKQKIDQRTAKILDNCSQKPVYENGALHIYIPGLSGMETMFIEKSKPTMQSLLREHGVSDTITIHSSSIKTIQSKEIFGG